MTSTVRQSAIATLAAVMAALAATGCASLRPPLVPADPPVGRTGETAAAQAGFHAVYNGEMKIWFSRWQAVWYVAVAPEGTGLSVAVLSPVGIKVMQIQGTREQPTCTVCVPGAGRLKPYGEALWAGLLWSVADGFTAGQTRWVRDGDRLIGEAKRGTVSVRYTASAATGEMLGKDVTDGGRRAYEVQFADERRDADRSCAGLVRIKCASPRCSLTLRLKNLQWNDGAGRKQ